MKKSIFILLAALCTIPALAQHILSDISISHANIVRQNDQYVVTADLDLSNIDLNPGTAMLVAPYIIIDQPADTIELPGVSVYTRSRYYHALRNKKFMGVEGTQKFLSKDLPNIKFYSYRDSIACPAEVAANTTPILRFKRKVMGCCDLSNTEESKAINGEQYFRNRFKPVFCFANPRDTVIEKYRQTSGKAYIQFEVNKTEIKEDLGNNTIELGKVKASIDSLQNTDHYTIRKITLIGYASPDGNYGKNADLAQGRTEVMKQYLSRLYSYDPKLLIAQSVPEDWVGFRTLVDTTTLLPHRKELLAIADSATLKPDQKEALIKRYKEDYDIMRTAILPWLRHTDYTIEYKVVHFTTAEECRDEFHINPKNLTLGEFYKAMEGLTQSDSLYLKLWATAITYFPDNEYANINMANVSMMNKQLNEAESYLTKAGNSAEAEYARGNLAAMRRDFEEAIIHFTNAASTMPEAVEALNRLNGTSVTK